MADACQVWTDCALRYQCSFETDPSQRQCICNHTLLFSGKDCEKTHWFIFFSMVSIGLFALLGMACSVKVIWKNRKVASRAGRWNASVTASSSILLSFTFMLLTSTAYLLRLLQAVPENYQALLREIVCPCSLTISAFFTVLSMLNISFLWLELATKKKLASQHNLQRSKKGVGAAGFAYLVLILTSYFLTMSFTSIHAVTLVYILILDITFIYASNRLSTLLDNNDNNDDGGARNASCRDVHPDDASLSRSPKGHPMYAPYLSSATKITVRCDEQLGMRGPKDNGIVGAVSQISDLSFFTCQDKLSPDKLASISNFSLLGTTPEEQEASSAAENVSNKDAISQYQATLGCRSAKNLSGLLSTPRERAVSTTDDLSHDHAIACLQRSLESGSNETSYQQNTAVLSPNSHRWHSRALSSGQRYLHSGTCQPGGRDSSNFDHQATKTPPHSPQGSSQLRLHRKPFSDHCPARSREGSSLAKGRARRHSLSADLSLSLNSLRPLVGTRARARRASASLSGLAALPLHRPRGPLLPGLGLRAGRGRAARRILRAARSLVAASTGAFAFSAGYTAAQYRPGTGALAAACAFLASACQAAINARGLGYLAGRGGGGGGGRGRGGGRAVAAARAWVRWHLSAGSRSKGDGFADLEESPHARRGGRRSSISATLSAWGLSSRLANPSNRNTVLPTDH